MGKCTDCIHNGRCLAKIKDSDFHGQIAGCNAGFHHKNDKTTPRGTCATCKHYGSSLKRMPCKGCVNNGITHDNYYERWERE